MSYYNTLGHTGPALSSRKQRAATQKQRVLAFLRVRSGQPFIRDEIARALSIKKGSVGRCLTDLKNDPAVPVTKTDIRRQGDDDTQYCYIYGELRHPDEKPLYVPTPSFYEGTDYLVRRSLMTADAAKPFLVIKRGAGRIGAYSSAQEANDVARSHDNPLFSR